MSSAKLLLDPLIARGQPIMDAWVKDFLAQAAAAGKVADPALRFIMAEMQYDDDDRFEVIDLDLLSAPLSLHLRSCIAAGLLEFEANGIDRDEIEKAIHSTKPVTVQAEMSILCFD